MLRLDGRPAGGPDAANKPLVDLVRWCCSNTPRGIEPTRLTGIESLVESVRRTEWEYPDGVNEMIFHALGVAGRKPPDFTGNRHLVISPFVNAEGLDTVAPSANPVVISRPEQLELLPTDVVAGLDCRWFATPTIGDDDEERPSPHLGELHAKVIVAERGRRAHVYVGSANATGAAFGGNVEIVVEIRGGKAALGIDATLADLAKVTEPCQIEGGRQTGEADELQRIVDDLLRDAALSGIELNVVPVGEEAWRLAVASAVPLVLASVDARVTVELLSRPGYALEVPAGLPLAGAFEDVSTPDVTPFVVVRVEVDGATQTVTGATVVRATLNGDPPGRLDSVIARQVDTPAKFLRFLFLLLGMAGGGIPSWLQPTGDETNDGSNDRVVDLIELGVFEALTRALVSSPAALADLGRLVDRLRTTEAGRRTLPEGFGELWEAVSEARSLIGATGQ
ncbi:MAG TPA: phospholipase D family protein [Microthrixaceae bacterium]|nr:phospholipase D family protein [Microthrixaceae bacterium]